MGRTTTAGGVVLLEVQPGPLLLALWFDLSSMVFCFQLCAISGRRTTRPRAAASSAKRGGTSRVFLATRSNRAPASGNRALDHGSGSAGRGRGSGPTLERENETETEIEQRLVAQEREPRAVVESLATVLGEVIKLSAAASQMCEMLLQIITDLQSAGSAADCAGSDGRSQ